jgi:hypothetical protein
MQEGWVIDPFEPALRDMVIIEEKIEDANGNIRTQKRILKLNKP